jgi:formamidopyrimidine-DNA glycosylase
MPELPEVELVTKSLNKLLKQRTILQTEVFRQKLIPHHSSQEFIDALSNVTINFIHRRGKNILFDLKNSKTLLVHLRMSGRFMLLPFERENPKHTHAIFYLDDETRLVFQDQRHFGFMRILETAQLYNSKELTKLAPEPFSDEFNEKYLMEVLSNSKNNLKSVLLNQSKVCGLGNIYASEALFLSKINPEIEANQVKKKAVKLLFYAIKFVLNESIEQGSTMNIDPENIDGSYFDGSYESRWRVYDQENKECVNCRNLIVRISQNGRSTFYCKICQKI